MHHAYLGGLLEHVMSLCGLCRAALDHYPEADADLLLCGAILHDVGKLREISYDRSLGYTDEGQLLGTHSHQYEIVGEKINPIPGFPPELKALVQHMILSHHGRYEFGSPKLPMFREALMLHYLDDSGFQNGRGACGAGIAQGGDGNWTAYNAALEQQVRVNNFLAGNKAASSEHGLQVQPIPV